MRPERSDLVLDHEDHVLAASGCASTPCSRQNAIAACRRPDHSLNGMTCAAGRGLGHGSRESNMSINCSRRRDGSRLSGSFDMDSTASIIAGRLFSPNTATARSNNCGPCSPCRCCRISSNDVILVMTPPPQRCGDHGQEGQGRILRGFPCFYQTRFLVIVLLDTRRLVRIVENGSMPAIVVGSV